MYFQELAARPDLAAALRFATVDASDAAGLARHLGAHSNTTFQVWKVGKKAGELTGVDRAALLMLIETTAEDSTPSATLHPAIASAGVVAVAAAAHRAGGIVGRFAGLILVNATVGTGVGGVRTNKVTSNAYPTQITPKGAAFAIWGPIFLLQAGGTWVLAGGATAAGAAAKPVAAWWSATWLAENLWQAAFLSLPIPAADGSSVRRLAGLVPAAVLLLRAHVSMVCAGLAIRSVAEAAAAGLSPPPFAEPAIAAPLVSLPTGINAGWLAAASGIGVTLVAQDVPGLRWLATGRGAASVVDAVSLYGAALVPYLGAYRDSLMVGLGYALATGWALIFIRNRPGVDRNVADAATRGLWLTGAGAFTAIAMCVASCTGFHL